MEESGNDFRVEELDRLLDELEQLAHSDTPRTRYYTTVLERFRFVLNAEGVAFAVRIDGRQWGAVASSGRIDSATILADWMEASPTNTSSPDPSSSGLQDHPSSNKGIYYNPLRSWMIQTIGQDQKMAHGAFLVQFVSQMPPTAVRELAPLVQAFGELIQIRQASELERFVFQRWPAIQGVFATIAESKSTEEAETLLVNDLRPLLGADRISLVRSQRHASPRLASVSGAISIERNSQTAGSIVEIANSVIESGKPVVQYLRLDADPPSKAGDHLPGLLPNFVSCPIGKTEDSSDVRACAALLFEWNNYDDLLRNILVVRSLVPTLDWVWSFLLRPAPRSKLARMFTFFERTDSLQRSYRSMRRSIVFSAMIIGVILLLFLPIPFRINMSGSMEPESQRIVYAAMDGVVEQVWVGDNAFVERGQVLLTMRSPTLELQIQEVIGELKANLEKRDALSLSLNQLAQQNGANVTVLNRVSSEIRQLETLAEMLQTKLRSLQTEQSRLTLLAPMDGIVIARDLDQLLDSRPLRRGDALFRIADPNGRWRLHLSVSDSDLGYLHSQFSRDRQAGQNQATSDSQVKLDFVIVSKPEKRFDANLAWLSDSARNSQGSGVFVDAIADIDPLAAEQAYIGATVEAFLYCGRRPLWFVFSRPLVEAIQRRLWF